MHPRLLSSKIIAFTALLIGILASVAFSQSVHTIYSFSTATGQYPGFGVLTQGRDGKLYGTTQQGGIYGFGTVFKQRVGATENVVLYNFTGGTDGAYPYGGLTLASDGSFYGTALQGGVSGKGVLFKITSAGVSSVLYVFTGGADGSYPAAPPIQATDGNYYGTTNGLSSQNSTLYQYNPKSGILTTIYTFDFSFGAWSQPLQGTDGNLYTMTSAGGSSGCGYIVKVTTAGVVKATHSFNCFSGGSNPEAALAQGADGNYYGTTLHGGSSDSGIIFKVDGKSAAFTVLHDFGATTGDGLYPNGGLTQAIDGNFYGATALGGSLGYGSLFQITAAGGYTKIYSFPSLQGIPYQTPFAPAQDTSGMFYGTTELGGSSDLGSIYALDMGLGPFVSFVLPSSKIGQTAQILGQGLTGTSSVTFNDVEATGFNVVTDTYMTAVVPPGATTGKVVVTTPSGPLTSNVTFRVSK
jgi:uncharacterized repeat protein (TIGR03803 family)